MFAVTGHEHSFIYTKKVRGSQQKQYYDYDYDYYYYYYYYYYYFYYYWQSCFCSLEPCLVCIQASTRPSASLGCGVSLIHAVVYMT